jgi:hypothetical protein
VNLQNAWCNNKDNLVTKFKHCNKCGYVFICVLQDYNSERKCRISMSVVYSVLRLLECSLILVGLVAQSQLRVLPCQPSYINIVQKEQGVLLCYRNEINKVLNK